MPKPRNIDFKLHPLKIDYFKLTKEQFDDAESFNKELLDIGKDDFISKEKHLTTLQDGDIETVVLNMQVRKGKTELTYKLIKEYYDKGYYIIVCSPFLKLVGKDKDSLISKFTPKSYKFLKQPILTHSVFFHADYLGKEDDTFGSDAFDGTDGKDPSEWDLVADTAPYKHRIHIMTVNCLLGNSGDDIKSQARLKRLYLQRLLEATIDQKVVIFFDEIHEAIHNFNAVNIPNLMRWADRVEKAFISSATFTAASIPVIKAISMLTDRKIRVYEVERHKQKEQALVTLHILDEPYNAHHSGFVAIIKSMIDQHNKKDKPVHIITGMRNMAEAVANTFNKKGDSTKYVIKKPEDSPAKPTLDYINLLTQKTTTQFDPTMNNVGTTFQTGINIEGNDKVTYIVFPCVNNAETYSFYGTFSEGVSAIIQAVGRMRKGGEMHLFIYYPSTLLGKISDYPKQFEDYAIQEYHQQNIAYPALKDRYRKRILDRREEITIMESGFAFSGDIKKDKYDPAFWFPNFHEYLLRHASNYLLNMKGFSFGKHLSPFILWSCVYDQFTNATLEKIKFYPFRSPIKLTIGNAEGHFNRIIKSKKESLKGKTFREIISDLISHLSNRVHKEVMENVTYEFDGKNISVRDLLNRKPAVAAKAFQGVYKIVTGAPLKLEKEKYIRSCMHESPGKTSALALLYNDLRKHHEDFDKWLTSKFKVIKGSNYILHKIYEEMDEELVTAIQKIVKEIRDNDIIVKSKAISFLQDIEKKSIEDAKYSIFNEMKEWSFSISKKVVQHNKENYFAISKASGFTPPFNNLL